MQTTLRCLKTYSNIRKLIPPPLDTILTRLLCRTKFVVHVLQETYPRHQVGRQEGAVPQPSTGKCSHVHLGQQNVGLHDHFRP